MLGARPPRRGLLIALFLFGILTVAPAARAQAPLDGSAYAFPVPDYVGSIVGANTLDPGAGTGGGRGNEPGERKPVRRATRGQLATLRFTRAPHVTQGVYKRVIDQVGVSVDPVVLTAQLDGAKATFREVLARVGWSASDLGDIAAFSLVQGYITWHQIGHVSQPGLKVLRREVRDNLALQKAVRRLSDARQQEIAEILELRVIFFRDAYANARASGESVDVAVARAQTREWIETIFGVDVNEVRLTRRGLVDR
jgi:hypothetical protein